MIFYAGSRKQLLLDKILQNVDCPICEKKTEQILQISCKATVFGLFYPFKWWAKDKKLVTKCTSCQTISTEKNIEILPKRITDYYQNTAIPFRYKLPSYIFFGSIIALGITLFVVAVSSVSNFLTPINAKIRGEWEDENALYKIYVFPDKQYSVIGYDTVFFGKYYQERNTIHFTFLGKENLIKKHNLPPLSLVGDGSNAHYFKKIEDINPFDTIFREENNQWRKKSLNPESIEELRLKVIGYLDFEKKKFELALQNNLEVVPKDPNAPVVFADNGIQVNFQSVDRWRFLFNNDKSWEKANEILHHEFPPKGTIQKDEENAFKRNTEFLKAYIQIIKASDLSYINDQ